MKILLVEDEKLLSASIKTVLEEDGYACETAYTFREAEDRLVARLYDLVVLDLNLPGGLGFELFEYLKAMETRPGALIISVRDGLPDKLRGLDLGADDYLVKPFHLDELLARVRSILRRRHPEGPAEFSLGNLRYQLDTHAVTVAGTPLKLTQSQLRLLYYLLLNRRRVVAKESLSDYVLQENVGMVDSLDYLYTHVKNVRQKLKAAGCDVSLETMYGLGYTLH
jgi:DNA-binding response OmpR family regulator